VLKLDLDVLREFRIHFLMREAVSELVFDRMASLVAAKNSESAWSFFRIAPLTGVPSLILESSEVTKVVAHHDQLWILDIHGQVVRVGEDGGCHVVMHNGPAVDLVSNQAGTGVLCQRSFHFFDEVDDEEVLPMPKVPLKVFGTNGFTVVVMSQNRRLDYWTGAGQFVSVEDTPAKDVADIGWGNFLVLLEDGKLREIDVEEAYDGLPQSLRSQQRGWELRQSSRTRLLNNLSFASIASGEDHLVTGITVDGLAIVWERGGSFSVPWVGLAKTQTCQEGCQIMQGLEGQSVIVVRADGVSVSAHTFEHWPCAADSSDEELQKHCVYRFPGR